jgi:putative ABC transport system ATP-binding protein
VSQASAGPGTSAFAFHHVGVSVDGTDILEDIDLDIPGTGITFVLGPSGSGKSTLTRLCNRLLDPTTGSVSVRGADAMSLDVLELRRTVGMVFQRPTVFAGTVRDNLAATGVEDPEAHVKALEAADLDQGLLERTASVLSGGEAQRVCLARTLLMQPQILVADEPTSALDDASARKLEKLALGLAAGGVPILWVSHDIAQFERIADHGVVLDHGRVVTSGSAATLLAEPELLTPFAAEVLA